MLKNGKLIFRKDHSSLASTDCSSEQTNKKIHTQASVAFQQPNFNEAHD